MKILIIENDYTTAHNITQALKQQSYKVDVATDARSSLNFTIASKYNLIIIDFCVPSDDSINLYQNLRFQAQQTPILLLTDQDATDALLEVLDDKIDDYLLKPFTIEDLILRSQVLLRTSKTQIRTSVLSWGDLRLDQAKLKVTYQNHPLSLTRKEYQLIELFLLHPQQIFSRNSIIAHIWSGEESPSAAAVTNLIKDLRQKLKLAGMETDPIETVYGIGYHLKTSPQPAHQSIRDEPFRLQTGTGEMQLADLEFPSRPEAANSRFYIPRPPIEELVLSEIRNPGSLIRIRAPRKMGKSSLLYRLFLESQILTYN